MDKQRIKYYNYVQESLKQDPIKDLLDEEDLVITLNDLFNILDKKLPNWKKDVEFDDDGCVI
jgi:hypothetical protein